MKKIFVFFLSTLLLFSATACGGNFSQTELNKPISIPENGIVEKEVLDQIKSKNAIATFTGTSNRIAYEWIIFGSNLKETRAVNLSVEITEKDGGILLEFSEKEDLGFSAQLTIHLKEKWTANYATAYREETPLFSVSITGSKTSILNVPVEGTPGPWEIRPAAEEQSKPEMPEERHK